MKLLLGTSNKGKIQEIREALAGLPIEILTPETAGSADAPPEDGNTYRDNALLKARFYHQESGFATLADDSGIVVDALQNELGVHTRRWGKGPSVTDHEWIEFFLERMRQEKNKRARFLCCLCFIDESGNEHLFEGNCDGVITDELEADFLPGLPISACFKPNGYDKVFSVLTVEEKNHISHRGKALNAFCTFMTNS